ncbi:MAG: hypothetical protein V3575_01315 [Candidatus Absconditabacteria bacterium]
MKALRKIFTSWIFYLYFVAFVMLFNFLTTGNVFSFGKVSQLFGSSDFKASSTYIRNDLVDESAISLVFLNLKIGNGDVGTQQLLGNALILTQQAQDLVEVDTVSLLENSSNITSVYDSHLSDITKLNVEIDEILRDIIEIAEQKRNESDGCKSQKLSSDNLFFNGLTNNDFESLEEGLENSTSYSICYEENRVISNAYYAVQDKLSYYNQLLKVKRDILDSNKDLIISNFQNFKNDNLEQLIGIRNNLRNYKGYN